VRNNSFQRVLVLRDNRTKRLRYGQVFVEGMRPLQLLVESRWEVDAFWYGVSRRLPSWAMEVLGRRPETRRYSVPPDMMSELSGRSDGSPLVAVARRPAWEETSVSKRADALLVACDRPASPGNVGTIVRCADALDASAVVLVGHSADPYDPKAISASTGACFLTPVLELAGPDQLARLIQGLGTEAAAVGVYAADAGGTLRLSEARFRGPTALLFGSERGGLSQAMRALASAAVRIESAGHVDSLNVATAAAILMYEVRRHQLGAPTDY
jgi:TrmH family RNA methyltransferase